MQKKVIKEPLCAALRSLRVCVCVCGTSTQNAPFVREPTVYMFSMFTRDNAKRETQLGRSEAGEWALLLRPPASHYEPHLVDPPIHPYPYHHHSPPKRRDRPV